MPCQDPRDSHCGSNHYEERRLRDKITRLTRACCDMRTILRKHDLETEVCEETRQWIAEHDLADAERIAEEQRRGERQAAKQAALNKLTMDERRMLGL